MSLERFAGKTNPENDYCMELMYHSAQSKQVLITRQKRRWMQINPDWFPSYAQIYDAGFGVFVGTGWHTRVERDQWLFLEQDGTYAAIRILRQILSNKLEIHNTVVTHETKLIVIYKGAEADEIVFNGANQYDVPTVGDEYIEYAYPKTFDSPYLEADYNRGVVTIKKGGHRQVMDFTMLAPQER